MNTSSKFACVALLTCFTVPALAQYSTTNVYLRSNNNQPWGQSTNEDAMMNIFGSQWTTMYYETANAPSLFNQSTAFIFMEGGDSSFSSFQAFMLSHGDPQVQSDGSTVGDGTISAWIHNGGRLLIMSAPNDPLNSASVTLPDSVILHSDAFYNSAASEARAIDLSNPIFSGPFSTTKNLSGDFVAHGYFTGSNVLEIMASNLNQNVLGQDVIGNGLMVFGGMTTDNFHLPQPAAHFLLENIIYYTAFEPI